jgi:hypothetical protein
LTGKLVGTKTSGSSLVEPLVSRPKIMVSTRDCPPVREQTGALSDMIVRKHSKWITKLVNQLGMSLSQRRNSD